MMRKADVGLAIAGVALFLIGCSDHNRACQSFCVNDLLATPASVHGRPGTGG